MTKATTLDEIKKSMENWKAEKKKVDDLKKELDLLRDEMTDITLKLNDAPTVELVSRKRDIENLMPYLEVSLRNKERKYQSDIVNKFENEIPILIKRYIAEELNANESLTSQGQAAKENINNAISEWNQYQKDFYRERNSLLNSVNDLAEIVDEDFKNLWRVRDLKRAELEYTAILNNLTHSTIQAHKPGFSSLNREFRRATSEFDYYM